MVINVLAKVNSMVFKRILSNRFFVKVFKIIFLLVVCLILWKAVDLREILQLFQKISVPFFIIVVLICIFDKVFMGYKWNLLLKVFGIYVPVTAPIIANLRSKVFPFFTPTTIGVDAYKAFYIKQCGASISPIVSSIIVERFLGALSSLAIILILLYFPIKQLEIPYAGLIAIGGLLAFGALTIFVALLIHFSRQIQQRNWLSWLPQKIYQKINESTIVISRVREESRRVWHFYFLSIVEKIAYGSALYFSARALGLVEVDYIYIVAAAPFLALMERLPVSISSIGLREGLIVVLLQPYFVDATFPVATALVLRFAEISMTVLCLFLWVGKHDGRTYQEQIQTIDYEISRVRSRHTDTKQNIF